LDDEVFRQFEVPPEGMDHVEGDHRPQWKQLIPVRIIISNRSRMLEINSCWNGAM
ncbi:unnamed protein product, partial [Musa hybrid cultivar]